MARLGEAPFIHPDCQIKEATFGAYVEIGQGSRIHNARFGDYSYCDRYADIANAEIGKFANIAAFARIGPTDHPMDQPSLHHFLYRSPDYFDDAEADAGFFEKRAARLAHIGHDTWIGHGAVIRPEVRIGTGAVVASMAVVTHDVDPYQIVAGIPAKPMRARFARPIAERLMALGWWDWEHAVLRERLDDFRAIPTEAFLEKYEGA
jgi:phosphonate metabolism protein (transferase hexapeptide repeat family)